MRRLTFVVLLLVAASACSSGTNNEPQRPPITRKLDASAYVDRPCALLPNDEAARLGYPNPGRQGRAIATELGERSPYVSCSRIPPDSPILDIDLYPAVDLLAREYAASKGKSLATDEPWLEPLTIADQPAAFLGRSHQQPNESCTVVVGLTDTQGLEVRAREHYKDPQGYNDGQGDGKACEYAIGVAEVIVKTLGG